VLTKPTLDGVIGSAMDLKSFIKGLPNDEAREDFARRCGTSLGHLRNVMYGYKPCATDLAVNIERESGRAVTRPELRDDWRSHWPELIGMHAAAMQPSERSTASTTQSDIDTYVRPCSRGPRRDGPSNRREER